MEELIKIYNEIAPCWNVYRKKPFPEVNEIAKEWRKKKFGSVLDIGCGTGRHSILLCKMGFNVVGVDFSKEMIKLAKKNAKKQNLNIKFIVADIRYLPFKGKRFNCCLAIAVIHHLKKQRKKALKEIARVARNQVLISIWNKSQSRFIFSKKDVFIPWKYKGKVYQRYYHLFTKKEIVDLIKSQLEIIRVFPKKLFSKNIFVLARPKRKH